ncbi:ATP-binding cassette domain-containing protein [Nonomuraea sp. SMC257]|uniref:ATP-binding cassette domain-containing protein n=1 Tax=Nonomuraea montanisoli TaxID=2741721 RepID=A0A7Y6M7F2_9ACTN|nr:ATP-binding cassette domain-containing protein [Nonomuraea montanisoli]NUW37968.1 ATP-binding cassette domain-containing protein [Nonomuraea montanisoli]
MWLTQVSFRYRRRDRYVIEAAEARLAPGDVVELTGANGAGKSTLLRLLAGLTRPTSGAVTDRPAVVGYVPDRFPTGQPFTVAGYLRHMARVRGGARWEPWAERVGLDAFSEVRLRELSKGTAHKVGLVQALMAEPGLLVLDEPFAGLDQDTRDALPQIVTEVTERGGIVVASDHQGGLGTLDGVRLWSLRSARLIEHPPSSSPADSSALDDSLDGSPGVFAASGDAVAVEVRVPARDLDGFLRRMRDDGYPARALTEEEAR